MRRSATVLVVAVLALGGYGAADVYDVVPGILTRDRPTPLPAPATPGPTPTPVALPTAAAAIPVLAALADDAPVPSTAALKKALDAAVADPALGPSVGVSIRDAATGKELYARGADAPRVIASAQKILAAVAISSELDPRARMTTEVRMVAPGELVLVAGGDTLLAREAGDPDATAGRVGLRDLAEQVAAAVREEPVERWTVRLDLTYAAGPGYPDTPTYPTGWAPGDVAAGFTQTVAMIGLADERPKPYEPSPMDPAASVLDAFVGELQRAIPDATVTADDIPDLRATPAPTEATVVARGQSAAYRDVLAEALDTSDNALTENLARQAALQAGRDGSFADNAAFVVDTLKAKGYDLTGTTLLDTSGLTRGQTSTAALLSQVTAEALAGKLPGLQDVIARLPVAGLDGTLFDRFRTEPANAAAGVARAKTGTLTGISSLVGTTVDADERELTFVIVADQVPASSGTLAARAALDRFVATLTACGCR